jgi:hypothetical protein
MDIDKLKALALAATPGPWHAPGMGEIHAENHDEIAQILYHTGDDEDMQCGTDADAAYIAAVCPATVLELIAEVERLRADAARWKAWKWWWMHSETEHAQLPPEVEELMHNLDLDEAMDAHIGAHHHAGREPG